MACREAVVERPTEAGLLHGDQLGQLPPADGERLQRKRFGFGGGVETVGHGAIKARDEPGVQPAVLALTIQS